MRAHLLHLVGTSNPRFLYISSVLALCELLTVWLNTPGVANVNEVVSAPNKKGMVLPFKPLSLSFNHMNYFVDMPAVSDFI